MVEQALSSALRGIGGVEGLKDFPCDTGDSISASEVFVKPKPNELLRGMRLLCQMTQAEVAKRVGVRPSNISEMEHGKRPIGKNMAKRLAETLNCKDWRKFIS